LGPTGKKNKPLSDPPYPKKKDPVWFLLGRGEEIEKGDAQFDLCPGSKKRDRAKKKGKVQER